MLWYLFFQTRRADICETEKIASEFLINSDQKTRCLFFLRYVQTCFAKLNILGQSSTKPYILRAPCKENKCIGENQQCIRQQYKNNNNIVIDTFCGTKECKKDKDCEDVGHITSGKNIAKGCKKGICTYSTSKMFQKTAKKPPPNPIKKPPNKTNQKNNVKKIPIKQPKKPTQNKKSKSFKGGHKLKSRWTR